MKINLALISPNQNAYSETFIQNHKKHFDANVYFYYGGSLPQYLEGESLLRLSRKEIISRRIKERIFKKKFSNTDQEKALINSLRKHKINAVYAEFGPTGVAVTDICKQLNLPLIVNFHGVDASMAEILDNYRIPYQRMFDYATNVVVVSKLMYNRLSDMGCPTSKLEYTPCAPDDIFFDIQPNYEEVSFLSVGRFVDKKAPYYTILAFRKVVEKYPNARLYMAGNGILLNTCINLCSYLKLDNHITFLNALSHKKLMQYYSKVRAFVQHSITAKNGDMEGTPVAVLEASAAALPVISTKHAGIPDVIIDGETGFLVEEHDIDGMAENMIKIIEDADLAKKMGEAGRRNVRENFCIDKHIGKLNELIYQI
jgi:Glycosyltransferase